VNHVYENSVAERVNGILKGEFGLGEILFEEEAGELVEQAIYKYNHLRLHMSCGLLTPFEAHLSKEPLKVLWKKGA
jgi:transposase InsO family protein